MNFIPPQFISVSGSKVSSKMFSQTIDLGSKAASVDTFGVRAEGISVSATEIKGGVKARVTRKSIGAGGQYLLDLAVENLLVKARVSHSVGRSVSDNVWTTIESDSITFFDKSGKAI